ncbi:tetratricopeptide repeat protein [Herbaspirillum frisingense]|uniref:tetratricopeptide repeat protein n=1 Tax=Herbaspirillum frisingense TaxID=92645 RepID=UPI001604008E|nr:tetratricopeptide repeat protein [Herbaspirillum frisingense]QNB08817.1 tetratricopeptide repeat protein [Herbaspirillum frisingense]
MSQATLPALVQQALRASQDNDISTALELLTQARREEPDSPWTCFLLAAHLAQAGRYDEAEVEYSNSLLLAPEMTLARYELGTLQFTSGRASAAMLTWQPLLALPDTHYLKLFILGYIALAGDNFVEAHRQFERGIAANSENPPLNGNMRLLIDRIREIPAAQDIPTPTTQEPSEEPGDVATEHFLLSGYGKNLH